LQLEGPSSLWLYQLQVVRLLC